MIIDSHFSLLPDDSDTKARLEVSTNYYDQCTVSQQLERMKDNRVDCAVVWPPIPGDSETALRRNEWLAREISRHKGKFIGFGVLYPIDLDGALRGLEHAIVKLGLKGIKVHPLAQKFRIDDQKFLCLAKEISKLNVPLVIHVDMREPGREAQGENTEWAKPEYLLDLLPIYNSPKVIAAHMGGICIEDIRKSKITFQTTGVSKETIEYACGTVGAERVLFGSDFPSFAVKEEIQKVQEANLTAKQRESIFSGNVKRLLSI
jgi:predicted TIM-barrel fold metal-dependent hydrolase